VALTIFRFFFPVVFYLNEGWLCFDGPKSPNEHGNYCTAVSVSEVGIG
jgi:hypothetical protein